MASSAPAAKRLPIIAPDPMPLVKDLRLAFGHLQGQLDSLTKQVNASASGLEFQDTGPVPLSPVVVSEARTSFTRQMRQIRGRLDVNEYAIQAALTAIYGRVTQRRSELYKAVDEIKHYYISHVILEQLAEDALTPSIESGHIVSVKMKDNREATAALQKFNQAFGWDRILTEIREDLLAYGEYTLRVKALPHKGIVDIMDDVDQDRVIGVPKHGAIDYYLTINRRGNVIEVPPYKYVKFMLGEARMRVNLLEDPIIRKLSAETRRKIPKFVRIGKSTLFPIIAKLKELELLEALVPATKIAKLSSGTLIGVRVPPTQAIEDAFQAVRQIEGMVNQKIGVDSTIGQLTIQNILSSAGRLKMVPIFGDKGELQKFDYKQDEPDELLATLQDNRRAILSSVGIPYESIYGGETADERRGSVLRRQARYLRRLKAIQQSFVSGIRQLVDIHLTNLGVSYRPMDLEVVFSNKLVQVDVLDELEYLDTTTEMLKNVTEFFLEDPNIEPAVNRKLFLTFIDKKVSVLGLKGVIDLDKVEDTMSRYEQEQAAAASQEASAQEQQELQTALQQQQMDQQNAVPAASKPKARPAKRAAPKKVSKPGAVDRKD